MSMQSLIKRPENQQDVHTNDLYYPSEDNKNFHLRDYIEILLRRKWIVIVFFVVVVITATVASYRMKPLYRAKSIIHIQHENPSILSFKNVIPGSMHDDIFYQTQYNILESKKLAKRVISKIPSHLTSELLPKSDSHSVIKSIMDLLSIPKKENKEIPMNDEDKERILVNSFIGKINIQPINKSQLVNVYFTSHDPELSAFVANATADEYINLTQESKLRPTYDARIRLEKQVKEMRAKLQTSEKQLHEYISKSQIVFLREQGDYESVVTRQLSELSRELDKTIADRITKEAIYENVKKPRVDHKLVLGNPLIQSLTKEYIELELQYVNLSKTLTPTSRRMRNLEKQIDNLRSKIQKEEQKIIGALDSDYKITLKKETFLSSAIKKLRQDVVRYQQQIIPYQMLKKEVETNREIYNALLMRLKEVDVSTSLAESNIQVLDVAEVPRSPFKPQKTFNILVSLVTGLFGGIFLAFFVEYFDNSVKTANDIQRNFRLPILGTVPILKSVPKKLITTTSSDKGLFSDSFNSIGTYVQFKNNGKPPKQILITSPLPKDGKSILAINAAKNFIHFLGKGILIDADLRQPSLHKFLNLDNSKGLSSYLSNSYSVDDLIKKIPHLGIDVITSGPKSVNPARLLNSSRMKEIIDTLSARYDYLIIDSAPVIGMADSLILSALTDSVIVVVKAANTPRDALIQTIDLLNGVNANVLGIVLNGINMKSMNAYSYKSSDKYLKITA